MCWKTKNFRWLILLWYLLYCTGLELKPQYLRHVLVLGLYNNVSSWTLNLFWREFWCIDHFYKVLSICCCLCDPIDGSPPGSPVPGILQARTLEWVAIYSVAAAANSLQSCPTVRPHRRQPTRLPRPWDSPGKNTGVGCHFLLQCMKVKSESEVAQLCPTLCDPMDCSLPEIFQARVLE